MALGKESLKAKFWLIRCFRFFSCLARWEFSILFSVYIFLFLSNERARCIYYIVSKFTALKYKPNKCIYLPKGTLQVLSTIYSLAFISFVYSFLSIIILLLLTLSHFQGFQTVLTILELSVSFSKLLVDYSFDSVIFHQLSSSIMEQKDQQVQCFLPVF